MAAENARPDTTDMIVIHQSLRREFALLPDLVAGADGSQVALVHRHLVMELTQLHDHHAGEDDVLWPALLATGEVDPGLVDLMESQHGGLAITVDDARDAGRGWREQPSEATRSGLVEILRRLSGQLGQHLDDEEQRVLPLVRAHLTAGDWQRLRDESARRTPKDPRVAIRLLGGLFEDASPAQRRVIEAQMPAAARLVWRAFGERSYAGYVRRLRAA